MGPNKPVQIRFYTLLSGRMDYLRGHVWDSPGCRRDMVPTQEEDTLARQHELAFFQQARNHRRTDPDHRPPGMLPNSNPSRHLVWGFPILDVHHHLMFPGDHWCCPVPGTLAKPPAKWRRLILLAASADSIRCEAEVSHLAESL